MLFKMFHMKQFVFLMPVWGGKENAPQSKGGARKNATFLRDVPG